MTSHRLSRVNEQILTILAEAVRDEVRDPRVQGLITLTGVRVTQDMDLARVYVSALGSEPERVAAVKALNHAAPFLRRIVAQRAGLRHTPRIEFLADATLETGARVERLLKDIEDADR
jgi:ribosome-binding factor A